MVSTVAVFTDTYHPTVNGVTYTIDAWARQWNRGSGQMHVVYPGHPEYQPDRHEWPLHSVPFPFYEGYRVGLPWIPSHVRDADVVHVHSLAVVGFAGWLLSNLRDVPLVASYHTPVNEYSEYLTGDTVLRSPLRSLLRWQERFSLDRADGVVVPSTATRRYLRAELGVSTEITVISNGVDLELFAPTTDGAFNWDVGADRPVVGYTGRHGHEKELDRIIAAAERMPRDPLVVFAGDGPARTHLQEVAADSAVDVRFLGFLPREQMPAFYSALDVFAFPSPIETEGIVAMEAIACGTPVVGADAAGLADTVEDGRTGVLYPPTDIDAFAAALTEAVDAAPRLSEGCLTHRSKFDVGSSISKLEALYEDLAASQ